MNPAIEKVADEPVVNRHLFEARRHFLKDCRIGLGSMALASLLRDDASAGIAATPRSRVTDPLVPLPTHFPARAKHVIFLFMAGGPSQLEMFDLKPKLQELHGQVIPESYVANKRFAFIKKDAKLLGTKRKFQQHGGCARRSRNACHTSQKSLTT